ncbi:hypothetical protein M878_44315 [Streptomyces roseochromogenus subsp. oscitans DS 12.976]|uniref:Uncharacterized protein n=1 Tax=Streptomyces roseochromogenus subsp. oscitans DS 12.976 TaxID=1352936 RepID=V6JQ09_STRRC|nr:hypothetical protein M878_44315 [Streptomyces roseochromogenus subsp. oscitans DS 12.976]
MGSGAGVIGFAFLVVYTLLMTLLCVFVGSRTSWRMGWLISVPVIFMPFGLLAMGMATH